MHYSTPTVSNGGDGLTFVPRTPSGAWDFSTGSFTADSAWHSLDVSSIVPSGAKLALVHAGAVSGSAGSVFFVAPYGFTGAAGYLSLHCSVAGREIDGTCFIAMDSNQKLNYYCNPAVSTRVIAILGWWI